MHEMLLVTLIPQFQNSNHRPCVVESMAVLTHAMKHRPYELPQTTNTNHRIIVTNMCYFFNNPTKNKTAVHTFVARQVGVNRLTITVTVKRRRINNLQKVAWE